MRVERTSNPAGAASAASPGRFLALFAALLVGILGTGLLSAGTASAQDQTYIIATDTTFAPFEFQDGQGNFVGIDMDLIRAIAKDQGFNVDIKPLGFDAALQAVQAKGLTGQRRRKAMAQARAAARRVGTPLCRREAQTSAALDEHRRKLRVRQGD